MKINDIEILITQGDITEVDTEAIVNSANNCFFMRDGVAEAIKEKGGEGIEREAVSKGPVQLGKVIITSAGMLTSKYVMHVVTRKRDLKSDEEFVRKAAYSCLICGQENKISSIAFCALGCGGGELDYETVSKIMAQEVFRYLREVKSPTLKKIVFVLRGRKAFEIFDKNIIEYLGYISKKISEGPFITVDGIVEYKCGIVMIERRNPPLGWALPGGFVDYGESVEGAVVREIKEETNLDFFDYKQFKVYSEPGRDFRFHTISVVFAGKGKGKLRADTDAKSAKIYDLDCLPEKIAFDHRKIIKEYAAGKDFRCQI